MDTAEYSIFNLNCNSRPSYVDIGDTSPSRMSQFDMRIKKRLSDEFAGYDNDHIKTVLRIRPPSRSTVMVQPEDTEQVFFVENENTLVVHPPKKKNFTNDTSETRFVYSRVFPQDSSQSLVFDQCARNVLNGFFEGGNGLIFSYGATNSGKTYTMQGYGKDFGIVPRTLDALFGHLEDSLYKRANIKPHMFDSYVILDENCKKINADTKARVLHDARIKPNDLSCFVESMIHSSSSTCSSDVNQPAGVPLMTSASIDSLDSDDTLPNKNTLFSVWVSFAEIYNERVYDLFDTVQKGKRRKEVKMFQDKQNRVYIKDLTECCVNTAEEAYQFFLAGKQNLQFASTRINSNSSRSHSFFNIRMVVIGKTGSHIYPKEVHRFTFCDLAGLERVSQTGNIGTRLKESGNINQSLLVLLRCIRGLREKQKVGSKQTDVIPYRDSKLTRLFQSYITNASQVCMIVNINPDPEMIESSIQVIQSSAIVRTIRTFKKYEAPTNDSAFFRKVRASIAFAEQTKMERTEDSYSEETPECTTVKRRPPLVMSEEIARLEAAKMKLKRKIKLIEDKTRQELQMKFDILLNEQREYYEKLITSERKHMQDIGERRLQLVVRNLHAGFLTDSEERENRVDIPSNGDLNMNAPCSDINTDALRRHTLTESSINSPDSMNVNYVQTMIDYKKAKLECIDLAETVRALQHLNDTKTKNFQAACEKLAQATVENKAWKEKFGVLELEVKTLKDQLHVSGEEILAMKASDSKIQMNELLSEVGNLSVQIEQKDLKISEQSEELKDAVAVVLGYHNKLEVANSENEKMTTEINNLNNDYQRLKQDSECMHMMVDDKDQQIYLLKSELDKVKYKVSQRLHNVCASSPNSPRSIAGRSYSDRPRRVTAKYSGTNN